MSIQKMLRQERINQGFSQAEVAQEACTTASAIARFESEGGKKRHSPSLNTVETIAEILGYVVEYRLVRK